MPTSTLRVSAFFIFLEDYHGGSKGHACELFPLRISDVRLDHLVRRRVGSGALFRAQWGTRLPLPSAWISGRSARRPRRPHSRRTHAKRGCRCRLCSARDQAGPFDSWARSPSRSIARPGRPDSRTARGHPIRRVFTVNRASANTRRGRPLKCLSAGDARAGPRPRAAGEGRDPVEPTGASGVPTYAGYAGTAGPQFAGSSRRAAAGRRTSSSIVPSSIVQCS